MDFPEDFDLAPLKEKHGEVVAVMTVKGPCVFRCPKGSEYSRYMSALMDQKTRADAGKLLVLICVVYPERNVMGQYLEDKPGIAMTCVNPLLELAGVDTEALVKK